MEFNLAAAAFWLALGGWFITGSLSPWLRQREVQKTLRALIERDGKIDAEALAIIRGTEDASGRSENAGWSGPTPRHLFAFGIFAASFVLGLLSLHFFFAQRVGEQLPALTDYFWGAGSFIVCLGCGGAIAYRVGRTPRRPRAHGQ